MIIVNNSQKAHIVALSIQSFMIDALRDLSLKLLYQQQ